jgi:CDP-glycerol glycerophosphotransferase (TagB/SpsB family)
MAYKLIFGEYTKIQDSDYFVNSSFFIDTIFSTKRRKDANDFKKSLEKTEINGQHFLELFEYGGISTWWFFSQETVFFKLGEIISFILNFEKLLSNESIIEVKITHDFIWKPIIEQICTKFKIPVTISFFKYSKFLLKNLLKNKFHLKQKKLKEMKNNRIKSNIEEFNSHKKNVQNINNKVVFVSPITYRRKLYNFNSGVPESREYLIDDLITIGNIKNPLGISIDYDSNPMLNLILKERLESNMEWFPEEILLKSLSKSAKIFLTKYNLLLQKYQFQKLFEFKNIQFWNVIKDTFLQMQFERYFPYWLSLLDSLDDYFSKNKPKSIFVTAEGHANTLAYVFVASKHNIKTIRIQQAIITEMNNEFVHDCYNSEKNPLGYPIPDYMLIYGSFSKQILIKNGYPVENLIEFGNPTYAFLDCLEKIDKEKFYSKHKIPTDRKIILFTSTKWQKNLMGKDFDPMIWKELLKYFSKNNEFFIILKPHPGENTTVYEKILSDYNYENATIIQDSLINLLYISDVVISNYSSVIIDAVCLNKPVVELIWDTVSDNPSLNFHKIGITIPTKLENLKFTINSVMEEQSIISQISQKRINFLNEHYGIPIDKSIMINKLKNLI